MGVEPALVALNQIMDGAISKTTRAKWTGGVAQVVEGLLCKHKALSSNPSPTKNKMGRAAIKMWVMK
jgi:hypothetical protein